MKWFHIVGLPSNVVPFLCWLNFILFTQIFATIDVESWPDFDNIKVLFHWTRNEGENCVFGIQDLKVHSHLASTSTFA